VGDYASDNFSNETVGGPTEMDQSGIFFAIVITADLGDQCLQHNLRGATIDREHALRLDGRPESLKVFTSPSENLPSMVLNSLRSGHCYQFDFITLNRSVRDANESIAVQILGSFRFGNGPIATP
jgi:hypothetical protein